QHGENLVSSARNVQLARSDLAFPNEDDVASRMQENRVGCAVQPKGSAMPQDGRGALELRHRLYEVLEHGPIGDPAGRLVGRLIALLIVVNLVAVTLESVPEFAARYAGWFLGIELVSLVVFTVEYALRLWVAAEHAPYQHSDGWKARFAYAKSPAGIIDL